MTVPNEILGAILDHVDTSCAAYTLFSCLTANKALFALASARLYRDPFRFAVSCTRCKYRVLRRLISLLLSLSPSRDKDVVTLRRALGIASISPTQTTIDYLGLVQKLVYYNDLYAAAVDILEIEKLQPYWGMTDAMLDVIRFIDTIYWAICGHQLARMREIVVCASYVGRYQRVLSQLAGVEKIWLVLSGHYIGPEDDATELKGLEPSEVSTQRNWRFPERIISAEFGWAASIVKSLVHIIEIESQNDTSLRPSSLDIRLCNYPQRLFLQPNGLTRPIFEHLQPAKLSRLGWYPATSRPFDAHDTWPRMLDAPESLDFSVVKVIDRPTSIAGDFVWRPEQRIPILQQCHSLRELHLEVHEDEQDIFAWAADMKQNRTTTSYALQRSIGSQTMTAVIAPLEHIELTLAGGMISTYEKPLIDALIAFGSTLKEIKVNAEDYALNASHFQLLPRLHTLQMTARYFVPHIMAFYACPKLSSLLLTERTAMAPHWEPSTRSATLCCLARALTHLSITGPYLNSISLGILVGMHNLVKLELCWWRYDSDPIPLTFSWLGNGVPYLPTVRSMHLLGAGLTGFQLVVLRTMPSLQELTMSVKDSEQKFLTTTFLPKYAIKDLDFKDGLHVSKLKIAGARANERDLQILLLHIFPNVEDLIVDYCPGVSAKTMRSIQKQLQRLQHLRFGAVGDKGSFEWTKPGSSCKDGTKQKERKEEGSRNRLSLAAQLARKFFK